MGKGKGKQVTPGFSTKTWEQKRFNKCNCPRCKEKRNAERWEKEEKEYANNFQDFHDPKNIPKLKKIEARLNSMQIPKKWE